MSQALVLPSSNRHMVDAELVLRVGQGDGEATRMLVDEHLPPITRFAYRMLGDATEAEDVAQEAFLRLWRQVGSWEPKAKLSTWLHKVTHNLCVDRLRKRREVPSLEVPEQADPLVLASRQLEHHEEATALMAAMGELPERQRAAISLVYYEGMSNREAAEVLGVDVDGLESLLVRGRKNLRKRLISEKPLDGEEQ